MTNQEDWTPPIERPLIGVKTHGVVWGAGFRSHYISGRNGKVWRGTESDAEAYAAELNKRNGCGYHAARLTPSMQETGSTD
jgi:hypothetical protein